METEPEHLVRYEHDLAEGERQLTEARATIERVQPQVENLRLVVKGLRGLYGIGGKPEPLIADGDSDPPPQPERPLIPAPSLEVAQPIASKMTYAGRPSIPAVIFDVMEEGREHNLDELHDRVCAHSAFENRKPPSRGSVTNRLNEMAERGEIVKVRRKVYKLAPSGADGNGALPRVQTEGPTEPQKPPDEEVMSPRPGHPIGEGSAKAAFRF